MSSHIQKSCVGLEATLSDSKKKYGDKVNALLSAWEHVTNFIPGATPEATQSLIEWAHKHTLKLVLRGEWPKLSPATKTHLSVTLQRCASHLVQHPAAPWCTALIALVHNPWTHPALDSILNGQPDSEHEEGKISRFQFDWIPKLKLVIDTFVGQRDFLKLSKCYCDKAVRTER